MPAREPLVQWLTLVRVGGWVGGQFTGSRSLSSAVKLVQLSRTLWSPDAAPRCCRLTRLSRSCEINNEINLPRQAGQCPLQPCSSLRAATDTFTKTKPLNSKCAARLPPTTGAQQDLAVTSPLFAPHCSRDKRVCATLVSTPPFSQVNTHLVQAFHSALTHFHLLQSFKQQAITETSLSLSCSGSSLFRLLT